MTVFPRAQLVCLYHLLFLDLTHCADSVPRKEAAQFSLSSLMDATLPVLYPLVAAGSDRCESLKSLFGITYDQIQENKSTEIFKDVSIDLITKDGNLKYNLTSRLARILRNSSHIVILIHGYLESSNGWMVSAVAPEFLRKKEYKIFALDGRDVISLDYFKSSTYVRFIGIKLGTTLSEIIKKGQDPSKIMLVGHSLGAHIAGVAGMTVFERTGRKLNRITGLDPALLCFTSVNLDERLDASDAEYVDVIHTNGGMLGMREPVGHKDFYPNDGLTQPGCILSTCDHSRAWELYAESVNSPKSFPDVYESNLSARKCENWTTFNEGHCSKNEMVYMGLDSKQGSRGLYFLSTGSSSPFGLGPAGCG